MVSTSKTGKVAAGFRQLGVAQLREQLMIGIATKQLSYIEGAPGIGKTQIIYQLANSLGYAAICIMVSECLPEDFGGIVAADIAEGSAIRLKPDIVSRIEKLRESSGKPVIAFFDEINNGSQLVFSACMKLLHEGEAGGFKVPADTVFIAAGNPPETSTVANELPAPLFNRMSTLYFGGPTPDEFEQHAVTNKFNPAVLAFLRLNAQYLIGKADFTEGGPQPTPRSWEAASSALNAFDAMKERGNPVNPMTRMLALASRVGEEAARSMEATLKYADKLHRWEDIKKNPKQIPATQEFVPAYMQVLNILSQIEDPNEVGAACAYIQRLPREVMGVFTQNLLRREDSHKFIDQLSLEDLHIARRTSSIGNDMKLVA